jgi:hypothetical protein
MELARGSRWERLKDDLRRARDSALELGVVLWITRVSVVSTAIGVILFIFIPQVRDTLLEVRGSGVLDPSNILFWVTFLVSAVVFWALPVHYAARRDLEQDPVYTDRDMTGPALWVPRVLGFLCTFSIAIGACRAQYRLLDPNDEPALFQTGAIVVAAVVLSIALLGFLTKRRTTFGNGPTRGGYMADALFGAHLFRAVPIPA